MRLQSIFQDSVQLLAWILPTFKNSGWPWSVKPTSNHLGNSAALLQDGGQMVKSLTNHLNCAESLVFEQWTRPTGAEKMVLRIQTSSLVSSAPHQVSALILPRLMTLHHLCRSYFESESTSSISPILFYYYVYVYLYI